MKDLKVAFFGTSDRSTPLLDALKTNFNLVHCVTKNDVPSGRHQDNKPTAVKIWAKNNNINLITVSSLKSFDLDKLSEQLSYSKPDYILVADFNFMIPDSLLADYPDKIINIHFSLLPKYRGACPVQFAILNGDEMSGITFHLVTTKMDQGGIIHQIGYKLAMNETSGELYSTLFELAARELPDVIDKYHLGTYKPREQNEKEASYTLSPTHPKSTFIYKDDAMINWKQQTAPEIERAIRAYDPWPMSWTIIGGFENNKKLCFEKLKLKDAINKRLKVKIISACVKQNSLCIDKLRVEGKNTMSWGEFENGFVDKKL